MEVTENNEEDGSDESFINEDGEGGLEVPVNPTEKTALMLCVT